MSYYFCHIIFKISCHIIFKISIQTHHHRRSIVTGKPDPIQLPLCMGNSQYAACVLNSRIYRLQDVCRGILGSSLQFLACVVYCCIGPRQRNTGTDPNLAGNVVASKNCCILPKHFDCRLDGSSTWLVAHLLRCYRLKRMRITNRDDVTKFAPTFA